MIDGAGHMMKLDPKGLEAAREQPGTNHEAIIRAYIDAIMPIRVSGLVERLRQYEGRSWETTYCYNGVRDEAGTSIENLSIGLATVWRNKLEVEDALASERAAHAETKARLAEARKALDDVSTAIIEADPKVLTCTLWMPAKISPNETVADFLSAAARRVREGGKADERS